MTAPYDRLGLHYHYKGPRYVLLSIAETHNHNGDLDCVYLSLSTGKHVTRPLRRDSRNEDSWMDLVMWPDGQLRQRFIHEYKIDQETLDLCDRLRAEKAATEPDDELPVEPTEAP